jgi:hypothetical protein
MKNGERKHLLILLLSGVMLGVLPLPVLAVTYLQKFTITLQGIRFDSNYDNGSLEYVTESGTNIFNCKIYEDSGELGPKKYWFRFKLSEVAGRSFTLNIDHFQNPRPVISLDGKKWRRLTALEAPSSSKIVLSFEPSQNEAELAFFYPSGVEETYERVREYVNRCDSFTSKVIGQSFQFRDMILASATDPAFPDDSKHRVWMHSRAHAGEATGTLALLGFLDAVTTDSLLGRHLRRYCIFNVLPLENVDGVFLGHTRWDSQGIDPERQWGNPDRIPETDNMKKTVDEFMAGENPIEVALNMHSTVGNYEDTFFYKHVSPSVTTNFEAIQQRYIDAVNNTTNLFDNLSPQTSLLNSTIFIESYFWNNWGEAVMAMTHEGHFYNRITDQEWITDDDYHQLGEAMAFALIEYFDLPPVIGDSKGLFWFFY